MSRWTHSICDLCWPHYRRVNGFPMQAPVRVPSPGEKTCCFCGDPHTSGIYVRNDPEATRCRGDHQDDEEE